VRLVIRSTPESIKLRQPSMVALLETVLSILVFFVLVDRLGWAFPTLLVSFSAPALLLRSAPSTRLGIELLRTSINAKSPGNRLALGFSAISTSIVVWIIFAGFDASPDAPMWVKFVMLVWAVVFVIAFASSASGRLQGLSKIIEVGYAAIGITFAVALLFSIPVVISKVTLVTENIPASLLIVSNCSVAAVITYWIENSLADRRTSRNSIVARRLSDETKGSESTRSNFVGGTLDLLTHVAIQLFSIYSEQAPLVRNFIRTLLLFALSYAFISATLLLVASTFTAAFLLFIGSAGSALGILVGCAIGITSLGIAIRSVSTLRFTLAGFHALPSNWIFNVFVIDLFHAPELLPRATSISEEYGTGGLLRTSSNLFSGFQRVAAYLLIACLYLSAILYRFSIKATAWIWWPLVIAAKKPYRLGRPNEGQIRQHVAIQIQGPIGIFVRTTLIIAILALAYQILASSEHWLAAMPKDSVENIKALIQVKLVPTSGLRLLFFSSTVILATIFWWQSASIAAAFEEVLKSPTEFHKMPQLDKNEFLRRSKSAEKIRLLLIASLLLFIELQLISSAFNAYPKEMSKLIWPWILQNI
jgi:hypothetical protein